MPQLPPLTLRLSKGSPLTPLEMDTNLTRLRDYANSLGNLFSVALNPDGTLKNPGALYAVATGGPFAASPSDYAITLSPVPASLADLTGKLIVVKWSNDNWGAVRVNPNALGNVNVKKFGDVALESDDMKGGGVGILVYDGTNFQYESWPGVVQPTNYVAATGPADAYVASHAAAGYFQEPAALYVGYTVKLKIPATNTIITPTITIGALPAVTIVRPGGSAVGIGDLIVNGIYDFVYDGTNFQLQTVPSSRAIKYPHPDTAFTNATAVVVSAQAHGLGGNPDVVQVFLVNKADTGAAHGYAVGDVLPMESIKAEADTSCMFTVPLFGTTFSLFTSVNSQNFDFVKRAGTSMAVSTAAQFVADWNVRVVLIRYT